MIKADKKTFRLLYLLGFLVAFGTHLPVYVASSYLERFFGISNVGLVAAFGALVTVFAIYVIPRFIRRYSNLRVGLFLLALYVASALVLWQAPGKITVVAFFSISFASAYLLYIVLDVFLEDIADAVHIGSTRTKYLTAVSLALFLVPAVMGYVVSGERYAQVYLAAALVMAVVAMIVFWNRDRLSDTVKYRSRHFHELLQVIFRKHPEISKIFRITFALNLFYTVIVLYAPFYLHEHMGIAWTDIGAILTVALLPFVLFEFPAGWLADHKWGERRLLVPGLIILAIFTGMITFIESSNAALWALVLFGTRVGAALVESTQDVHFFRLVKKQDIDLINLFRDLDPAAFLIGSLVAAVLLASSLDLKYIFILLAIVIALMVFKPALTLRDVSKVASWGGKRLNQLNQVR